MVELAPQNSGDYALNFAGDTFNTAWYLQQLAPAGLEVAYLTGVGDDALSGQLTDFMRTSGIVPEVSTIAGRTLGLYMISLQDGERSFHYWRDTSAARKLTQNLEAITSLAKGDMVYFSGITMAILSDDDRVLLLETLSAARESGVTVVFDTNLRPRLWKDVDEMCKWVMQSAAVADIALPSFDDEANFFGDADKQATMARYREAGVGHVIVKDGPGAVLFQDEQGAEAEFSPTLNTDVVDTTAAGDSFNAAFLAAHFKGQDMRSAIAAGCDLSHWVISHKGALVSIKII